MKRTIYNLIMGCMAMWALLACNNENELPGEYAGTDGNHIVLNISSGTLPMSRMEDTDMERAIDHIDVLIFNEDGSFNWHERVTVAEANKKSETGEGTITLSAKRDNYTENTRYWVYLIANSSAESTTFDNLDLNELKDMKQTDRRIHMTGTVTEGAPAYFLMDGVAYAGSSEPASATTVVLNDGNQSRDTELNATLRRAAAKIVVKISKGSNVTFTDDAASSGAGYYLRNMPFTTSVVAGTEVPTLATTDLRTPTKNAGPNFSWSANEIVVTAYAYEHAWENESALQYEVRLIVNIPLTYSRKDQNGNDVEDKFLSNNYYQIPVSKEQILKRNTYYEVTAEVNAPGAEDPSEPVILPVIKYSVAEWENEIISIEGEGDRPAYLTLNENEMEMHNLEDDYTTLRFVSSSPVTATITKVYYKDKFDQEQVLELTGVNANEYGINTGTTNRPNWTNQCTIRIIPDESINGQIEVYSTLPENNTIRYIEFTITNEEGINRSVTVAQYPLEYITNILAWYSYRSDFLHDENDKTSVTTYELLNGLDVKGKTYTANTVPFDNQDWICGCSWSNNSWSYAYNATGFFGSKVAGTVATSGTNAGKAHIYYYRWSRSYSYGSRQYSYSVSENTDVWDNYANPRMYHVRITASSGKYTLGRPRITNSKTDPGSDNAELVSPSFMIASQLGAVQAASDVNIAASHCEQYVEVYKDEKTGETIHLDDWRLPTRAELEIIMDFQYASDAMDEVLAGPSYWSASGLVTNSQGSGTARAIRCIRDAYDGNTTSGN